MSEIFVNGTRIHYRDTGPAAFPPGETIVFSHGLLMNHQMFADQIAALRDRYRCIAYDHRGQGQSDDSPERAIGIDRVTEDAAALIRALGGAPVHFCGLSMGGFVAMRLALREPALLRSILLLETAAGPEPAENRPKYRLLNGIARWFGLGVVTGRVLPIMFGESFLTDPARAEDRARATRMIAGNRRSIWRAVNGVIERDGVEEQLRQIRLPTLVIVGEEDIATPPAKAEAIAAGIPGATLVRIPRAGHSSSLEEPAAVTAAIEAFLAGLAPVQR